ncbi:hypothetical protein J2R99_002910 [Rhodopseudomonas julia]|uniref:Uncharacterized protein n=1 Tax=Rhodopseudomonas julia TaxID=200617 RepID=A0ABU0C938_9BRAD|nr:hypothetical protein [Rhodopseudomonas julia]
MFLPIQGVAAGQAALMPTGTTASSRPLELHALSLESS